MENEIFYNIGKIIERDSKTSTYKFALLRGVIDIIQESSPLFPLQKDVHIFRQDCLLKNGYYIIILYLIRIS